MATTSRTRVGRPRFDADRLVEDMTVRGWDMKRLSEVAGVADMTVIRFLRGEFQTPATAKKLADALGYSVRRYLVSKRRVA